MFSILYSHYMHYHVHINIATNYDPEWGHDVEPPPYLVVCSEVLFDAMKPHAQNNTVNIAARLRGIPQEDGRI